MSENMEKLIEAYKNNFPTEDTNEQIIEHIKNDQDLLEMLQSMIE
jgi:hypothetical protein